jgi:hypothetical protein
VLIAQPALLRPGHGTALPGGGGGGPARVRVGSEAVWRTGRWRRLQGDVASWAWPWRDGARQGPATDRGGELLPG